MIKISLFLLIFILGEVCFNLTWFKYLKSYFDLKNDDTETNTTTNSDRKFIFLNLSTFKGILERFIITIGLIFSFAPILIVFGTIKLGTRFKDTQEVKNDYFLIGNFSSILISLFYYYLFTKLTNCSS